MFTLDRISFRNDLFQRQLLLDSQKNSQFTVNLRKNKRNALLLGKRQTLLCVSICKHFPPDLKTIAPFLFKPEIPVGEKLVLLDRLITPNNFEYFPSFVQVILIVQSTFNDNLGMILSNFLNMAFEELRNVNCPIRAHLLKCIGRMIYESNSDYISEKHIIILDSLLKKRNTSEFFESLVIILGNIAADSIDKRDLILNLGAYKTIFKAIDNDKIELKCLNSIVWAICSFLKGFPLPPLVYINQFLYRAEKLLKLNREEITCELLWGLSYIFETPQLHAGVFKVISFQYLCSLFQIQAFKKPALRCLGIIIYHSNYYSEDLISSGVVEILFSDLKSLEFNEIKDTIILLSNISESGKDYAHYIIQDPSFSNICSLCSCINEETKLDSLSAVESCVRNSDYPQVLSAFNTHSSLFSTVTDNLSSQIPETLIVSIKILRRLFESEEEAELFTKTPKKFYLQFNQIGGLNRIEGLQMHENHQVYVESQNLIQRFWEYDV